MRYRAVVRRARRGVSCTARHALSNLLGSFLLLRKWLFLSTLTGEGSRSTVSVGTNRQ